MKRFSIYSLIGFTLLLVPYITSASPPDNVRGIEVWQAISPKQSHYTLPSLWVLAVGVSRYEKQTLNLKYADADARSIAEILKKQEGKLFGKVHTKLLTNEQATRSKIMESFSFLNQAAPDDMVFIFVAGHGVKHKVTGSYYFLPYPAHPDNLMYEGLRWADFQEGVSVLRGNVNKVILAIDTCHAGAMQVAWRGGGSADLAAQIKHAEGLFTLAASKAGEDSVEIDQCRHGAFTCALLEAFSEGDYSQDGVLMVSELFQYVSRKVPQISNGRQHPYQTISGTDLPIAVVGEIKLEDQKRKRLEEEKQKLAEETERLRVERELLEEQKKLAKERARQEAERKRLEDERRRLEKAEAERQKKKRNSKPLTPQEAYKLFFR